MIKRDDRRSDLLADNSHGESHEMPPMRIVGFNEQEGKARSLHKIAGGVVFDAPQDQPSTARSTAKGRATAQQRAPTSKPKSITKRKRGAPQRP